MYEALDPTERANKAALLLAHERYNAQFAPFVKGQLARLSYVNDQIDDMIEKVSADTGADSEYVKMKFKAFLESVVNVESLKDIKETDVMSRGEVEGAGMEEALKPDERQSLAEYTIKGARLSKKQIAALKEAELPLVPPPVVDAEQGMEDHDIEDQIMQLQSAIDMATDENELESLYAALGRLVTRRPLGKKEADAAWNEDDESNGVGTGASDVEQDPQMFEDGGQMMCVLCERAGKVTEGTMEDLQFHVQQEHADEVARANAAPGRPDALPEAQAAVISNEEMQRRLAEVPRTNEDVPRAEPLPNNPGDEFDEYVQHLAESAAARKFSLPDEQMIHSIASQIGQPPEDVKNNLIAVATFGNLTATNGEIGEATSAPEGYEEVSAQGVGGRIDATEALVPVDLVISKVAEKMNMEQDLAYNMIRDRYGADLPDKYHASVAGEVHLYLPSAMAGNQAVPNDPEVGPTPQPAQPVAPTAQPTY